jgi:hypothetical protein
VLREAYMAHAELALSSSGPSEPESFNQQQYGPFKVWTEAYIYHAMVKRIALQNFLRVNQKDYTPILKGCSPDIHHRFGGHHALGGERHDRDALILTAQEAIHLVSQHVGVAIVTKPASVGLSIEGVVIRPLSDPSLSFETCLIMRSDDDSRLANEFGRSFLRRYAPQRMPPKQMEFWLSQPELSS